jgi:oxalate decarboxylase/phosphoglucose isomerase-like protein (cupin superfamily)
MQITQLHNSTDDRGLSFSLIEGNLRSIAEIKDIHIAEIKPGRIRGNHYHAARRELITVVHEDKWSLHWDTGEGTSPHHKTFTGSGAVLVTPPLNWSHAVRNDGPSSIWIVVASDRAYDRDEPDEHKRDAMRRAVAQGD